MRMLRSLVVCCLLISTVKRFLLLVPHCWVEECNPVLVAIGAEEQLVRRLLGRISKVVMDRFDRSCLSVGRVPPCRRLRWLNERCWRLVRVILDLIFLHFLNVWPVGSNGFIVALVSWVAILEWPILGWELAFNHFLKEYNRRFNLPVGSHDQDHKWFFHCRMCHVVSQLWYRVGLGLIFNCVCLHSPSLLALLCFHRGLQYRESSFEKSHK